MFNLSYEMLQRYFELGSKIVPQNRESAGFTWLWYVNSNHYKLFKVIREATGLGKITTGKHEYKFHTYILN